MRLTANTPRIGFALLIVTLAGCVAVPRNTDRSTWRGRLEPRSGDRLQLVVTTYESVPLFTSEGLGGQREVTVSSVALAGTAPRYERDLTLLDGRDPSALKEVHYIGSVIVNSVARTVTVDLHGAPSSPPPVTCLGPVNGTYRLQ